MATLIGDYGTDHSRFHHSMIPAGVPYQPQHSQDSQYRSRSRSKDATSRPRSSSGSRQPRPTYTSPSSTQNPTQETQRTEKEAQPSHGSHEPQNGDGASRFPTPPDSSSPSESNSAQAAPQHARSPMASSHSAEAASEPSSVSTAHTVIPASSSARPSATSIPSPASDGGLPWTPSRNDGPVASADAPRAQKTIHITDLAHIQKLAQLDLVSGSGTGILDDPPLQDMKFEISAMPIGDIIEMVAALLTKITTTNDLQHDALNRNVTHQRQAQAQNEGSDSHTSPFSTSVLAFHGKNVPAITILSYLSRIHKYCPTTYEVFLSLLVYFDRMTDRINELVMKDEESRRKLQQEDAPAVAAVDQDTVMHDDNSDSDEVDEDLADSDDEGPAAKGSSSAEEKKPAAGDAAVSSATYFVVDSFNIHRLIIAGVTCASKFFSDVFYTNSRYAKVGGLPLAELNHLELQFLLLNDFRLAVPVEDLEAYATMLVEFYAREVVAQRSRPVAGTSSES